MFQEYVIVINQKLLTGTYMVAPSVYYVKYVKDRRVKLFYSYT